MDISWTCCFHMAWLPLTFNLPNWRDIERVPKEKIRIFRFKPLICIYRENLATQLFRVTKPLTLAWRKWIILDCLQYITPSSTVQSFYETAAGIPANKPLGFYCQGLFIRTGIECEKGRKMRLLDRLNQYSLPFFAPTLFFSNTRLPRLQKTGHKLIVSGLLYCPTFTIRV